MQAILWLCAAVAAGLYIVGPIQDPDLWWHIAAGKWILSHGAIPHQDVWSLFSAGSPWRAYSWSNEVVYALVDQHWGIEGLLVLKMLLAVVLVIACSAAMSRIAENWSIGLLLGTYATFASFNHFTLRPQALIWAIFALLLAQADAIEREGLSPKRRLALVVLMCGWANTHLSAVLGLFAGSCWVYAGGKDRTAGLRRGAEVLGWCLLGTLITPYLGGEWATFLGQSGHPLEFRSIAEFKPATIIQYSTVFLLLLVSVLIVVLTARPRSLDVAKLLAWGIFCLGSLAVVKFLPFAVIFSAALLAREFRALRSAPPQTGAVKNLLEAVERFVRLLKDTPREGLSFVLICLSIVNVVKVWRAPLALDVVPKAAVDFIQEKKLPGPIANVFGHGGYLIYRLSDAAGEPIQRVAIDGRTNLIAADDWRRYSDTYAGHRNWRDWLEKVNPETILWREDSPLVSILLAENKWCLVFESGELGDRNSVLVKPSYYQLHRSELSAPNCDGESSVERQDAT